MGTLWRIRWLKRFIILCLRAARLRNDSYPEVATFIRIKIDHKMCHRAAILPLTRNSCFRINRRGRKRRINVSSRWSSRRVSAPTAKPNRILTDTVESVWDLIARSTTPMVLIPHPTVASQICSAITSWENRKSNTLLTAKLVPINFNRRKVEISSKPPIEWQEYQLKSHLSLIDNLAGSCKLGYKE